MCVFPRNFSGTTIQRDGQRTRGRGAAAKRRAFGAGVTACCSAGATVPDCRWSRFSATPLRPVRGQAKTVDHRERLTGIVVDGRNLPGAGYARTARRRCVAGQVSVVWRRTQFRFSGARSRGSACRRCRRVELDAYRQGGISRSLPGSWFRGCAIGFLGNRAGSGSVSVHAAGGSPEPSGTDSHSGIP